MLSQKSTTTALIRDLDLSATELQAIVAEYFIANRMGTESFGDSFPEVVAKTVSFLEGLARGWPVGTILSRSEYELVARAPQPG